MAALDTVADYLAEARVLLQDTVSPYRYADVELVSCLNQCMTEVSRLRPDILQDSKYLRQVNRKYTANRLTVPYYSLSAPTTAVDMPPQYRVSVLYYVVGAAQLRDLEETQDQRSLAFQTRFVQQLLTPAA
jgi:hypothetical protein